MIVLGIDIGGSGVKGAPVNVETGEVVAERHRIETPQPSTPEAVSDVVAEIVRHFDWKEAVGITFPGIVQQGVIGSAANVDKSWVGVDGKTLFEAKTQCPVVVLNDADAAGLAEVKYGAGAKKMGTVLLLTFGTGIGSALIVDGKLVPNTELGHLVMPNRDMVGEHFAAGRIRKEEGLKYSQWGKRVNEYLNYVEFLFSPNMFIIGGGISKKFDKFSPYLNCKAEIVPAQFRNFAGIIGAAYATTQTIV